MNLAPRLHGTGGRAAARPLVSQFGSSFEFAAKVIGKAQPSMHLAGLDKESGVAADLKRPRIARAHRLQAARQLIEDNLHRHNLAPAAVARELGISLRQLHMLFEPTGQSFSRYLLARRLEAARAQLASHPDRAVVEIALACGIRSSTVFYRGFAQAFGMNPTEYRLSLSKAK
jgi:AraC-like DNA-binding protein